MSRRIKPKRNIHVRISMKEFWRNMDGLPKIIVELRGVFELEGRK